MELSHVFCPDGPNSPLPSQSCILETTPRVGAERTGQGEGPQIAQVQLKGHPIIMSFPQTHLIVTMLYIDSPRLICVLSNPFHPC